MANRAGERLAMDEPTQTALANAVADLIAEPQRQRLPNLGTLVNPNRYVS
jgi:hypothetical protein